MSKKPQFVRIGSPPEVPESREIPKVPETPASKDQTYQLLDWGMTPQEVSSEYGLAARVVRYACERGQVAARKVGTTWLIDRASAAARWANHEPQDGPGRPRRK